MKTVLVTGSSGFLGSRVVAHSLESGFRVVGIDIKSPTTYPSGPFEFIQTDVNQFELNKDTKIDFIIHTASSLPYGNSDEEFDRNNVNAARLISELAHQNDTFLVEIGSSSVYGRPKNLPVNQSTPLNPLDAYAKSKAKAEEVIKSRLNEKSFCVIRPRTILGTGRAGIFSIFFSLISGNIPLPLPNSGRQIVQFVHVDDLAALSVFLGANKISGVWPAASPEPKSLSEYLHNIGDKYKISIRYIPIAPRIFEIAGGIAYRLKLTKFTPWHFGAFPYDNFVDPNWVPNGFRYQFTSSAAFEETYLSNTESKFHFPKKPRIGKSI